MYIVGQTAIIDADKILNDIGCLDFVIGDYKDSVGFTKDKRFMLKIRTSPESFWNGITYVDIACVASKEKAETIRNEILKAFSDEAKSIIICEDGKTKIRN